MISGTINHAAAEYSRTQGGSMTRQRATILEIIRKQPVHYTAEEIYEIAKTRHPGMSFATVYNNLHALERDEMIRRITAEDGSSRYDRSFAPHGHLYCSVCRCITDFEIPDFSGSLTDIVGKEIDSYELKVRYVCPACAESKKETRTPAEAE